jgi:hypothetical protein
VAFPALLESFAVGWFDLIRNNAGCKGANLANFRVRTVVTLSALLGLASAILAPAYASDMAVKAPPPAQPSTSDTDSYVIWMGAGYKDQGEGGNIGGIYALNGNLGVSGWAVRGQFVYVDYRFPSTLSASGTANGTFTDGNASIGYQYVNDTFQASGFVGYDYQDTITSPAAAGNPAVGAQSGAIFSGRVANEGDKVKFPVEIDGSYSTAYNSFWARGRTGMNFGTYTIGPELIGMGDNFFDEARIGGYVTYKLSNHFILDLGSGYADALRGEGSPGGRGGSGVYVEGGLVFLH